MLYMRDNTQIYLIIDKIISSAHIQCKRPVVEWARSSRDAPKLFFFFASAEPDRIRQPAESTKSNWFIASSFHVLVNKLLILFVFRFES